MTYYIAELDEVQKIAAVWVKEETARGPSVFDPGKHVFDTDAASGFLGAPQESIAAWIAKAQLKASAAPRH